MSPKAAMKTRSSRSELVDDEAADMRRLTHVPGCKSIVYAFNTSRTRPTKSSAMVFRESAGRIANANDRSMASETIDYLVCSVTRFRSLPMRLPKTAYATPKMHLRENPHLRSIFGSRGFRFLNALLQQPDEIRLAHWASQQIALCVVASHSAQSFKFACGFNTFRHGFRPILVGEIDDHLTQAGVMWVEVTIKDETAIDLHLRKRQLLMPR